MRSTWMWFIAALALSVGLDATVSAQHEKKAKKPKQTHDQGVDDDANAALVPVERNVAGATVTLHPNGMLSAKLDESFEEAIVVTRNADGTLAQTCIHGLPIAANTVKHAKPAASGKPAAQLEVK